MIRKIDLEAAKDLAWGFDDQNPEKSLGLAEDIHRGVFSEEDSRKIDNILAIFDKEQHDKGARLEMMREWLYDALYDYLYSDEANENGPYFANKEDERRAKEALTKLESSQDPWDFDDILD